MRKFIVLLIEKIINRPKQALGVTLLLTVFFAAGLPKIQFDSSIEFLMPKEDPAYIRGERANMAFINGKTFVLTSIEAAEGYSLFSEEVFQYINEMVKEIEEYKTFDKNLETSRLDTLISLAGVSFDPLIDAPSKKQEETTKTEEDLEAQLDELMFSEEPKEEDQIQELLEENKTAGDIWDESKPLPKERFTNALRPRRKYNYTNYLPLSLKTIRENLDTLGQKQLDTIIQGQNIETPEEESLSKSDYKKILETWETLYLFKSMEVIKTFMNPITGEDISGKNDELKPIDFVPSDENGNKILPRTKEDFDAYKKKIRLNPLNKVILYSQDENGEIRALSLSFTLKSLEHYIVFEDVFWPLLDKYNRKPVVMYSLGSLVIEKFMSDFMKRDLRIYIPLVLLFVVLTFFLNFRSLRGVILPTLTVIIGAVWTMGLMGHLGFKMSMLVSILPPLLIAIGSSYSIHMFNQYLLELETIRSSAEREAKLTRSMTHISVTVLLAAITTFISFMTLSVNQVTSLRDFGIFAATGAIFSMAAAFILIPATLILLKDLKTKTIQSSAALSHKIIRSFLHSMSYLSIRHSKVVVVFAVILFVTGFLGLLKIRPETSPMLNFLEDSYIRQSDDRLNELFNGTFSLNLIIDSGEKNGAKDPEFLRFVEGIRTWLKRPGQKENYNILSDASFGDFIKRLNMAVHNDDLKYFSIPDTKADVADYLEIFSGEDRNSDGRPDAFEQVVDSEYRRVNLIIRTGSYKDRLFSTALNEEIRDHVTEYMTSLENPNGYKWFMTGAGINMAVLAEYILNGQILSVLLSLFIIAFLIYLLFRNSMASLVSVIPISMAIAVVYGIMGYLNIPLDIPKVVLSSIAIGIGIDDTIHFMKTLSHHMGSGKSLDMALQETFEEAGVAISYTSIALVFGFSILILSNFKPIFFLGLLVASVMSATTMGALLFLPAFIKVLNLKMRDIQIDS